MRSHDCRWLAVLVLAAAACGVRPVYVPRADGSSQGDLALERAPAEGKCTRDVRLLDQVPAAPFRELRTLSVTCDAGRPAECDEELRQRACTLGADAVVLSPERGGASGPVGSIGGTLRRTREGRAIRLTP